MKIRSLALAITALLALPASAELTFNGFASIRGSQADSDGGTEPFSNFREGQFDFKAESLFALQARADLGEGLSATVQLMAEGRNDFNVEARWAYISYELNDSHTLSAGRFANPIFHQSEYEKVGYVHNFARLPKAVYIGFDFSTVEGIALDSTFNPGDLTLRTKLLYGNWNGELYLSAVSSNLPLGLDKIASFNATLSGDWWQLFAGGFTTTMSTEVVDATVLSAFAQPGVALAQSTGATDADIANFYDDLFWNDKDGRYLFAGFSIDYNDWLLDFEATDYGIQDSSNGTSQTWFASIGRRWQQYIVTVHREEFNRKTDHNVFNDVNHPALLATGAAIQAALVQREFDGYGVTLRYDFHPNAALKVDYFSGQDTRVDVADYSIFSIGVDLVF